MTNSVSHLYDRAAAIIDLGCIGYNLDVVRQKAPGKKIVAMVKSNAYGHGLTKVAQYLVGQGIDYLGVAFVEEGVLLRKAGIDAPVLVTGPFIKSQLGVYFEYDIDMTVASIPALEEVEDYASGIAKRAKIHLQVDTGMMRVGVRPTSAEKFLEAAAKTHFCDIVSVYSHFATADGRDLDFTRRQLELFLDAVSFYEKHSVKPPLFHIANSAGLMRLPESQLDMVRPGIMLYGYHPSVYSVDQAELKPALSLRAKVAYFKVILDGTSVGYGQTWTAPENCRAATLLIGYGDGYFRNNSNKSDVLINGQRYPVVGNISMDHLVISLGKNGEAYKGDEAVLIGRQGEEAVTADELAQKIGTINYEILTNIGQRVPRVYINDGT
jgi:alanine racemase